MESRLKQIRSQLGLRQEELAEIFDCRKENISMIERGKSSLSERNKKCLVKKFNLNPLWLEGKNVPMFDSAAQHAAKVQQTPSLVPASVPLYDIEKIPSLESLFGYRRENGEKPSPGVKRGRVGRPSKEEKAFGPKGYISIPGMPRCDGAVKIAGEGMSPVLGSGDIVMYRQLDHPSEIFYGETYLLSVETSAGQYIAVRQLKRSKKADMVMLSGENPAFADTEIPISAIRALALVKASIRMNTPK